MEEKDEEEEDSENVEAGMLFFSSGMTHHHFHRESGAGNFLGRVHQAKRWGGLGWSTYIGS